MAKKKKTTKKKAALKKKKKKIARKPKKVFHLTWAFEQFEEDEGFYTKRMFGGMAAYCHGKMVMLLAENPGDRIYREKVYDFDIWNGVLLPTEYELQDSITKEFPTLVQHPVLKKWLYIPLDTEDFEDTVNQISSYISDSDERFGIFPKLN